MDRANEATSKPDPNDNDVPADQSLTLKHSARVSIKRDDKFRRFIKRKSTIVKDGSCDQSGGDNPGQSDDVKDDVSDVERVEHHPERSGSSNDTSDASDNVSGVRSPETQSDMNASISSKTSVVSDTPKVKSSERNGDSKTCQDSDVSDSSVINKKLLSWGSSFASFVGDVGKQALSNAMTVVQTTLQYMPETGDLSDDDVTEEWHDAQFVDSSSDSDLDFEDAVQQLQPRDRIHNICHELLSTEESYVIRLGVLVMAKEKTGKLLGEDIAKGMFRDIQTVHQFHSQYLLPQLRDRLNFWEKYKRIGDIMAKFTPFLKLYTEYVKNFESAAALVETWSEKSTKFAALLKEIQEDTKAGRNRLQAHMLEPVQRVPRYELLLRDYLKRLEEDSPDRADTQKALELVAQAASHFEDMMKRDSQVGQLMQLQRQMDGAVSLVGGNRKLLKKGKVSSLSAKSGKRGDRIAFLFTDLLIICAEQVIGVTKYKIKHSFTLSEAQTAKGNNLDYPHTFYIKTTERVVELCFSSADEMSEWEEALVTQMRENTKRRLVRNGSKRVCVTAPMEEMKLGRQAPVLVRQSDTTMCMICAAEFTTLRRKRHCRACGIVVCAKCSSHSAVLDYDRTKSLRVCDECFVLLSDHSDNHSVSSPTIEPSSPLTRTKTKGECVEKGFLFYSSDNGRTWKKRWFTLHLGAMLYSFKAPQDISPLTSMCLDGYQVEYGAHSTRKTGQVLQLKGMGKTYLLHDEGTNTIPRWFSAMEGGSVEVSGTTGVTEPVPPLTSNQSFALTPLPGSTASPTAPQPPSTSPSNSPTAPQPPSTSPSNSPTAPQPPSTSPSNSPTAPQPPSTSPSNSPTAPQPPSTSPSNSPTTPQPPYTSPPKSPTAPQPPLNSPTTLQPHSTIPIISATPPPQRPSPIPRHGSRHSTKQRHSDDDDDDGNHGDNPDSDD